MSSALMSVAGLEAGYRDVTVLRDVDVDVMHGECLAVIGANGAGKTTLLRALSGMIRATAGRIDFDGNPLGRTPAHTRNKLGLIHLPEGRGIFRTLSVRENLRLVGAVASDYAQIFDEFPLLADRIDQPTALLSGGEQQMLALSTLLVRRPKLVMIDELSFGLAPVITAQLGGFLKRRVQAGCSVILVEESLPLVLAIADRVVVLQAGRVVLEATAEEVRRDSDSISKVYLAAD